MLLPILLAAALSHQPSADFRGWGLQALASIQEDLLMPDAVLYGEGAKPGARPTRVAYNWGVGVMLQALNAAARVDRSYQPRLARFVDAIGAYWNPSPPVAGYDVLPGPKRPDRYYDDNEWMVLALVESSGALRLKPALGRAVDAFRFVGSGEDGQLGGGIYWRESDRKSKNTCSNAPAIAGALALFRKTHQKSYLETATRLYAWTRAHLRDPSDGLYWDNISLDGRLGRAKWSYNSGLMLRDAAELFDLTKQEAYAADARELQSASLTRWVGENGALKDEGKFMFLLVDAWLTAFHDVKNIDDPRPAITAGLTYVHEHCRDSLGHYGSRWDRPTPTAPYSPFTLIDQAAAARAFLVVSRDF